MQFAVRFRLIAELLKQRWATLLLSTMLIVLLSLFGLLFVQNYRQFTVLGQRLARGQTRIEQLEGQVHQQEAYLNALLTDPDFMEHVARERLGYAKEGELIFHFKSDPKSEDI